MRWRRRRRIVQLTSIATVGGGVVSFVLDVTANQLNSLGTWVPWTVIGVGIVLIVLLVLWQRLWPPEPEPQPLAAPLPRADELVGRDRTVAAVMEKARSHRVIVVHGSRRVGTSSVAITAARELIPDERRQRYVDLRGVRPDDARSARMHVLRTLGLDTRGSEAEAIRSVTEALTDSGRLLLVDNATGARQVAWLARAVPGAYVVIAGELAAEDLPDAADVPVQELEPEDALALLRHQDAEPPPRLRERIRDRIRGVRRHSIDARIAAEKDAAAELARHYLQHPHFTIQLGRWLARNPHVRISALLDNLRRGESYELRRILRETLTGASPGAQRLLTLLVAVPALEYPDEAVAALAKTSPERTSEHLTELARRFLVYRGSYGSRVRGQAMGVVDRIPPRDAARAYTRLVAFYADLAEAGAELPPGEQHADAARWFAAEDVTLQGLLGSPKPPKQAARHLWRIADALDAWFAHEERHDEREDVAGAMLNRAEELGDTAARVIARIRLAAIARRRKAIEEARRRLNEAEELTRLTRGRAPWLPQLKTESALYQLAIGDLEAARRDVDACRRVRPSRDLYGALTDLINLAVIAIRDGDPARPSTCSGRRCGWG